MKRLLIIISFLILLVGCSESKMNNLVLPTNENNTSSENNISYSMKSTDDLFNETTKEEQTKQVIENTTSYYTYPTRDRWSALKTTEYEGTEEETTSYTYETTTIGYVEETVIQEIGSLETTEFYIQTEESYTETETVIEEETTVVETQPMETNEEYIYTEFDGLTSNELPTFYRVRGNISYIDKTVIPDSNIFRKDAYGNYIIPMYFLRNADEYEKALPYNNYGKIPYCYAYDENGVILNPLPKEYEEFKDMFMFGQTQDYNNKDISYTEPYNGEYNE